MHNGCRRAFTLLEILVVIAIIIILASIALYVGQKVITGSRISQTSTVLVTVSGIQNDYTRETNRMPTDMSDFLTKAMSFPASDKQLRSLPRERLTWSGGNVTGVIDAWGNPLRFFPNTASGGTYYGRGPYFQSAGPDGTYDNSDDIYSFAPQ